MSDNDMTLAQAVNECGKWGNLLRALGKVSEVATFAAQQDQLTNERASAIVQLGADIEAGRVVLEQVKADVEHLKGAAEEVAKNLISAAQSEALAIRTAAKADVAALEQVAQDAKDSADNALRDRAAVKEELNAARAELDTVRKAIDEAKADARRRFGG